MDGWMEGWMNERMTGRMDGWTMCSTSQRPKPTLPLNSLHVLHHLHDVSKHTTARTRMSGSQFDSLVMDLVAVWKRKICYWKYLAGYYLPAPKER